MTPVDTVNGRLSKHFGTPAITNNADEHHWCAQAPNLKRQKPSHPSKTRFRTHITTFLVLRYLPWYTHDLHARLSPFHKPDPNASFEDLSAACSSLAWWDWKTLLQISPVNSESAKNPSLMSICKIWVARRMNWLCLWNTFCSSCTSRARSSQRLPCFMALPS